MCAETEGGRLKGSQIYLDVASVGATTLPKSRSPAVNDIFFQRSAPQIPGQTGYTSYHTGAASPR